MCRRDFRDTERNELEAHLKSAASAHPEEWELEPMAEDVPLRTERWIHAEGE